MIKSKVTLRCPDITKASNHFSYKPKVLWNEGLELTLKWYEEYFRKGGKVNGVE